MVNLSQALREELAALEPLEACCARRELESIRLAFAKPGGRIGPASRELIARVERLCRRIGAGVRISRARVRRPGAASSQPRETSERLVAEIEESVAAGPAVRLRRCCRGAVLRGAFWKGAYLGSEGHLEFAVRDGALAELLRRTGQRFLEARRTGRTIFYLKERESIAEAVGVMGAFETMLRLEDLSVSRRMRNDINRVVNCEIGNLSRISRSSVASIDDIRKLSDAGDLEFLPARLQEVARLRLRYPTASLRELAGRVEPAITKSGMQHRLEEIARRAAELRRQRT